jgi:hypothetical protein
MAAQRKAAQSSAKQRKATQSNAKQCKAPVRLKPGWRIPTSKFPFISLANNTYSSLTLCDAVLVMHDAFPLLCGEKLTLPMLAAAFDI